MANTIIDQIEVETSPSQPGRPLRRRSWLLLLKLACADDITRVVVDVTRHPAIQFHRAGAAATPPPCPDKEDLGNFLNAGRELLAGGGVHAGGMLRRE